MKSLSKDDRRAIFILLAVILVCFILFPFIDRMIGLTDNVKKENIEATQERDSIHVREKKNEYYAVEEQESKLFPFDPNTADSTQLLRLGLRPWQVRNIYKYRAAGGRYNKPTDFARLYGLTLKQYKRLEPYIRIEKEVMAADVYEKERGQEYNRKDFSPRDSAASPVTTKTPAAKKTSRFPQKLKPGERIDINIADTNALKKIPGIGSYFARQIVRHRERLGGIADVSQLLEIEGFPETSLSYTYVGNASAIKKIKVNQLDAWKLSRHPYVLYIQAKEIVAYRQLHGNITSSSQLESLKTFSLSDVKRLTPYLDFSH